ncbi:phage holin, LLH family [Pullulanibacillus sp. KACC 23026]|uniref:phage holin, LLH family n=1 Tax=Pullulanibacillus sp. KACC 23026 TaxID=3028315 RepID=UPI0023B0608E|nr:phage holin, LLH family [Pullulanibacillus sp. KACC 23026]WEG14172.1 phage holin, LLH family [Pullulanibacillus sp. KACC 23026]
MFAQIGYDVLPYVVSLVVAFGGYLLTHVGAFLKAKIGEKNLTNVEKKLGIAAQQIQQKKGIAYDAVHWAEDKFKQLGGPDKLSKAVDWAVTEAKKLGIDTSKQELEDKIRVAFTEFEPQLVSIGTELLKSDQADGEEATPEETTPDPEPTPEPEVEKPLTEMTSTDLKNIVNQAVTDHLQTQTTAVTPAQTVQTTTVSAQ